MPFTLYNSLTKHEVPFTPLKEKEVTMYTCGPTVYGRPHIGNYSSFLMADLLRRWLEVGHGYTVKHVKNITDVGHLVADQDEGEDKVQKEAEKEKVDPLAIAERYTEMYLDDEKALNICEPFARPRASAFVAEMIDIIEALMKKGHAYETEDGIYFSVETFPSYGTLSGNTLDKLNAGARIAVDEAKKHPADFALWKKCVGKNAKHILRWSLSTKERVHSEGEDPLAGFPGWHIECSAMSSALLGKNIDIHTGGEDNIFPHHECEIAQSCCAFDIDRSFANVWIHKRRIDLAGEKMSKSLGNVLSLPDICDKGYSPLDLRYYLLSVHYRTNLKFTWKGMDDARKERVKIQHWVQSVYQDCHDRNIEIDEGSISAILNAGSDDSLLAEFRSAMNGDLNTPAARAAMFHTIDVHTKEYASLNEDQHRLFLYLATMFEKTFGCFTEESKEDDVLPAEVQSLIDTRKRARDAKDFTESDRLRDEIAKHGYEVKDQKDGTQEVRKMVLRS
jgi:cysteinyl-tRNA synthetase